MKVLYLLIAVVSAIRAQVEPYGTEICRLFADDARLRSAGSCQKFVTCKNGESIVEECGPDEFYDKTTQGCATDIFDAYCSDPCESSSPFWVTDPKSCEGYYRCSGGFGTLGSCSDGLHFEEDSQSCVYADESSCKGYAYCHVVPDDIPFKDESSCNKYFMCVYGMLTEFLCENGYYHPQQGCIKKSEVECAEHPTPINACGTPKVPIRNKFVKDQRTCRGYYYCADKGDNNPDLNPTWGQCPKGYFFDLYQQACFTAAYVRCEEDRCDGQNRTKVISATLGCKHYLLCNGDVTIGEEQCESGMYFDDSAMACTTDVRRYDACS